MSGGVASSTSSSFNIGRLIDYPEVRFLARFLFVFPPFNSLIMRESPMCDISYLSKLLFRPVIWQRSSAASASASAATTPGALMTTTTTTTTTTLELHFYCFIFLHRRTGLGDFSCFINTYEKKILLCHFLQPKNLKREKHFFCQTFLHIKAQHLNINCASLGASFLPLCWWQHIKLD